ncbi:unnamed protein product [Effrenium voratum]|nr:unnamed protein product [Effrenium voratum]
MLQNSEHDVRRVVCAADPAAFVPPAVVDSLASQLSRPIAVEIAHLPHCPSCGSALAHKTSTPCRVLSSGGLTEATHVALHCRRRKCDLEGKIVWANFLANSRGDHTWLKGTARPDIAMLSPHFGVTWEWHVQFGKRILHHHASFLGESYVHGLAAAGLDHGNQRVRDAWCKLQLLHKWDSIAEGPFPLSRPFADIFAGCRKEYDGWVREQFRAAAQPQPQVVVIDGNQKLTRRTCAELLTNLETLPGTDLMFLQDCSRTPKRKNAFCSAHTRPPVHDDGIRVAKKACVADNPAALLRASPRTCAVEWPLSPMLRDVVHFQSKMAHAKRRGAAGEDLDIAQAADFVSCRTVKMRRRVNRRSGVACAADGAVLDAVEFLGGESLTQRAAFVARLKERYPFIATVVHDDSCHLRRFMDHWCRSCPQLCFPAMHYVIDKFHAVTRCDAWCRANCAPSTPVNEAARLVALRFKVLSSVAQMAGRLECAWDLVEKECDVGGLFGDKGKKFLEEAAAKRSLHPLAVGLPVLATLAPLANGAKVRIWSEASPLCTAVVLINPPQSRKSQTTSLAREVGLVLDEYAQRRVREELLRRHGDGQDGADPVLDELLAEPSPSCVLEGFTPEAFFEAVSGDYSIKKAKGRVCKAGGFGRLANVDEVYPSFLSFGLIDSADTKGKTGVNSCTLLLNRFLQTGGSSKLTRTAGAYGGAAAQSVSFALVGNAHPSMAMSMLEGSTGCQVAAAHDRLLFFTAPRVAPHEEVPESVQVEGPRYFWADLPPELADLAGIAPLLTDPERAAVSGLKRAVDVPAEEMLQYIFKLPDGVVTRLKYSWTCGEPRAQMRIPNRLVVDSEGFCVAECARRVAERFRDPHQTLEMDNQARACFLGYQTLLNVRANAAAQVGSDKLATRMSIGPWHLGMLAALMALFDVFVGACEDEKAVFRPNRLATRAP